MKFIFKALCLLSLLTFSLGETKAQIVIQPNLKKVETIDVRNNLTTLVQRADRGPVLLNKLQKPEIHLIQIKRLEATETKKKTIED